MNSFLPLGQTPQGQALHTDNLQQSDGNLMITICFSKTDQVGIGQDNSINRVPYPPFSCLDLQEYFLNNQPQGHPVLLIHEDGSPLTQFQVKSLPFSAGQFRPLIGAPTKRSETHSFHIGAATAVVAALL